MSVSKAIMVSVIALSLVTGAGVALNFSLLDNDTTWLPVVVAVVSVGACPFAAGWLSHRLTNVALFPASVLVCLSVSFMILGAPSSDVAPIPFGIALSIIYGGLAAVLFCVGWTARRYNPLARIGRASGKQRHE